MNMAGNGNEFLPNYVEYLVPLKESKYIMPKRLLIGSIIAALVILVLVLLTVVFSFLAGLVPVALIVVGFLGWYLWRFASIEYEYTILQGEMTFEVIYGKQQRKAFYKTKISDMESVAPAKEPVREADFDRTVFAASTMDNPNTYRAVVREADGTKTLLYFEVYDKTLKVLRFYNPRAFA